MSKLSSTFAANGARVTVVLEVTDYVSFTGTMDGGGQIQGRLREVAGDIPQVSQLCDLWGGFHFARAPFDSATEFAINTARTLLASMDGERYGGAIEPGSDDFEESTFSNSDDVIDSRDVVARIEYLRDYLSDLPGAALSVEAYDIARDSKGDRSGAVSELAVLLAMESEAENYAPDWRYGETLVRDDYFTQFAEQLAEDIGAVNSDAEWPNNHIDWNAAAQQLKQDYTAVKFDGVTYWIR